MDDPTGMIGREALADYLRRVLPGPVEIIDLRPLAGSDAAAADPKGFGYGVPFEAECRVGGEVRRLVVSRTQPVQGFDHDYPADRAWQAIYAHRAYNGFPRHARSIDVGFVRRSGELVRAGDAVEFFQLVERVPGALYWLDLERLISQSPRPLDTERATTLARFLAEAHAVRRQEPTLYERRIRELVGHGECLMGILDSYPHPYPPLPPESCEALERAAVSWRWRLRGRAHRLARTHGDFHPWNLLFTEGTEFSVLDRSRGEWGEPADDVAALGVNYLFFGLRRSGGGSVAEPFRGLFHAFLDAYREASGDREILEVLPPFLAFRALVIGHPRWYPALPDAVRAAILRFARAMMTAQAFDPSRLPGHLASRSHPAAP
jgi:hypothetical protein